MNLQNGYTVLNEKITDGERTFIAKGPEVEDKEIGPFAIGEFKLVYEKDGQIYGSTAGIPTEDDTCLEAFDAIFIEEVKDSETETPVDPEDESTNSTDPKDPEDESTEPTDPEDGTTNDSTDDPADSESETVDPDNTENTENTENPENPEEETPVDPVDPEDTPEDEVVEPEN